MQLLYSTIQQCIFRVYTKNLRVNEIYLKKESAPGISLVVLKSSSENMLELILVYLLNQ